MPQKIVADLHNHTTASDGEYTPEQLVTKANELGLKAIGVTDHDTLSGLDTALKAGEKIGITVVPGVEVSLAFKRDFFVGTLHLILYFKKELLANSDFVSQINQIMSKGRGPALVEARVKEINAVFGPDGSNPMLQNPLTYDEVADYSPNVTRRHFALALREKHGITDRNDVSKIIGNDSPAYIPSGIDMKLLQPLVSQFPVLRVFAHPAAGSFPGESHYKEVLPPLETVEKLLPEFLDPQIVGLDGIEVYYPGHTAEHSQILLNWAEKYNLIVTGGSDCHDTDQRPLGLTGIGQKELDLFLEKLNCLN